MKTAGFKKNLFFIVFLIIAIFLSIISALLFPSKDSISEKDFHILLTHRLYDAIDAAVEGPIQVSKSMSKNTFVIELLKNEDKYSEEEMIKKMQDWLSNIKSTGNYTSAFLVSEKTKRYYTANGLNKVIDPKRDSHDIWYTNFVSSNQKMGLDIDVDQANQDIWTIFLNLKIEDEDKNLLGVCGIGIQMANLQKLFKDYEKQYNIKINLVDYDGLVLVDTNSINIENSYKSSQFLSEDESILYTQRKNGFVSSCYVNSLNWYLVIKNSESHKHSSKVNPLFLLCEAVILILLIGAYFIYIHKMEIQESKYSKTNNVDYLTGLNNRNYFKETYGERGVFNTTRYKSLAVFDIDSFKETNDRMNGDKILVSVTKIAKEVLGPNCELFRWGGDEFTVLMEEPLNSAYELCKKFCKEIENAGDVTVSIGITEVHLSDSVKKNYYRAVQGCYIVKELGGNGVKRS